MERRFVGIDVDVEILAIDFDGHVPESDGGLIFVGKRLCKRLVRARHVQDLDFVLTRQRGVVHGAVDDVGVRTFDLQLDEIGAKYAWRFRMPNGVKTWTDDLFGPQVLNAKELLGDFVVARSYGVTAYQLAVVVDDHDFGINHVVRGNDLVFSTYRQNALYEALGWKSPAWLHLPLVVGIDGRRLAKRHGDTRLSHFREQGVAPEAIVAYLAKSLGFQDCGQRISPHGLLRELEQRGDWIGCIPRENHVISAVEKFC